MVELDKGDKSPPPEIDCRAFWEFGTIETDVGRAEFRRERPLCPLIEVVFVDFS